jgi:hypothetical protein
MGKACSTNGVNRNAYTILVGKPEGKRQLGRPKRRWEDIKMDLREMGWIAPAQDTDQWTALVNTAGKFLSSCTTGDFSRRAQLHGASWA